jgi:RHS repeat-associated protein
MKRSFLIISALAISLFSLVPLAVAQYQTGCGNDDLTDPGNTGSDDPDKRSGSDDVGDPIAPHKGNLHRDVSDITTFGPAPIAFGRNLNSRTTDFNDPYWELGYKQTWQTNWNYEVRQLSTKTYGFFDIKVRYPDGNDCDFHATDATGAQLAPTANNGDRLYRWTGSKVGYTMVTADGTEYDFWRYLSPKFHLTEKRNGVGYFWDCTYDANQQLTKITNNFGNWIQITHETGLDGVLRINHVTTSDGRTIVYNYSTWATSSKYILSSVTYPGGEQAAYAYVTADPSSAGARPLLAQAYDPKLRAAAQMNYTYNYQAIAYGSVITGTVLQNSNAVTGKVIASLPQGSGNVPEIIEGNGPSTVHVSRTYANGLIASKADAEGRTINFTRDQGGFGYVNGRTEAGTGAVTNYTRDYAGHILSRTDAIGKTRSFTYNSKGFVLSVTDELNRLTTITRDTVNSRRTRVDYPDGSYEAWTYNSSSQPLTHRLRNGGTESFAYDSSGNLTKRTDPLGNATNYTYYANGLVSSVTDARLNTTSYTYNWRGQTLTVTHPDTTIISYQYDAFGNRTSVTDELNHTTVSTYDAYNRLHTVTDALNRTTTYEYGETPGSDDFGFVKSVSRVTLPSDKKIEYTSDETGRRLSQTMGAGTTDAATTIYAYDSVGNVSFITDPRGKTSHFTYNLRHQRLTATDPLNHTTTWTYDDRGNKLTEIRPDGGVTNYVYDSLNRLVSATDPKNQTTSYTYGGTGLTDAGNNLVKLTDARSNSYLFNYDLDGRKTAAVYPDGSHENWSYDPDGDVVTFTTRAGQVKTSTYDNRNRQTLADWNDSTPDITMTYDAASRVLSMVSNVSALSYNYDAANEALSETQNVAGSSGPATVSYSYDPDGNRASATYPDGHIVAYGYTARNQVNAISVDGASALATYGYDSNGNATSKSLENGTSALFVYDDANREVAVDHQTGGTSFARFDYVYNSVNNRTSRTETDADVPSQADVYGYDAIDQLTQVKYNFNATANTQDREVDYLYDATGNRTSVTDNGSTTGYAANNLNEYTSAGTAAPSYDSNGNLSAVSGSSYGYDAQNRLTSASSTGGAISCAYDPLNRCVVRTMNGITTFLVYDGWNLIEEIGASGVETARYVHGTRTDELLARVTPTSITYYHHDAVGSAIALTDGSGNPVERYSYDVYGMPMFKDGSGNAVSSSATGNRFLFTGREYLQQAGLYDYRNRMYAPTLGRFLQTDPIRFDGLDINLYRYVGNNALNAIDPSGLSYVDINISGGFIVGFTAGLQINGSGVYPYIGGGLVTPGIGGSVTYSQSDPAPGEWSVGAQGQFLAAYQGGRSFGPNGDYFQEIGAGIPPGGSLTAFYTFPPGSDNPPPPGFPPVPQAVPSTPNPNAPPQPEPSGPPAPVDPQTNGAPGGDPDPDPWPNDC